MKKVIGTFWAKSSNAAKAEVFFWAFCAVLRGYIYAIPYSTWEAPQNAAGLFLGYSAPLLAIPFLSLALSGKLPLELLRGQIGRFPDYFNRVYNRKLYFHLSLVALIGVSCAVALTFFYLYADQWGERWMSEQRQYFHQYGQSWLNRESYKIAAGDTDLRMAFLKLQKIKMAAIRTGSIHLDVLQFFQSTYYSILVLGIVTTLLAGLVLANLVKIGWDNSSTNLKTTFLYLAGTSVFFNVLPDMLNHEEIIKKHALAYENCVYLDSKAESFAQELHSSFAPKLKTYGTEIARLDSSHHANLSALENAGTPDDVLKYRTRIAVGDSLSAIYTHRFDSMQQRINLRFDSLDLELYTNSSVAFKFAPDVIDNLWKEMNKMVQQGEQASAVQPQ